MTPDELIAYARGYLDGYSRGEQHTMTDPPDPDEWRAIVQRWRVESERALARLMWDAAARDGGDPPTDEEIERRLWLPPNS